MNGWFALFFIQLVLPLPSIANPSRTKSECSAFERRTKTCELKVYGWKVQVRAEKVVYHDTRSIHIVTPPSLLAKGDWESVRLFREGQRWFLEMRLWGPEFEKVPVQDLHWMIAEIIQNRLIVRLDEVIQRRSPSASHPGQYHLNPREKMQLISARDGLHWKAGHRSGVLSDDIPPEPQPSPSTQPSPSVSPPAP